MATDDDAAMITGPWNEPDLAILETYYPEYKSAGVAAILAYLNRPRTTHAIRNKAKQFFRERDDLKQARAIIESAVAEDTEIDLAILAEVHNVPLSLLRRGMASLQGRGYPIYRIGTTRDYDFYQLRKVNHDGF